MRRLWRLLRMVPAVIVLVEEVLAYLEDKREDHGPGSCMLKAECCWAS